MSENNPMTDGRSPIRPRQLHDLRLPPTKDDPRPTFFFQEADRYAEPYHHQPFPAVRWDKVTGEEIGVDDAETLAALGETITDVPPNRAQPTPMDALRAQLDGLTDVERAAILDAQNQARKTDLQARLAALTPEQLETLLAGAAPVKRGPGRPKKTL